MAAAENAQIAVTDNPHESRYEIRTDGTLAGFSQYRREPGIVTFVHTEVDPAFEGRGLGSKLIRFVLDDARARHEQVIPLCPFVAAYIRRHPEYDEIVAASHRRRLVAARERERAAHE